jgi:tRNA(Arg) A34 adenosine deaminase TadA
MPIRPDPIFMRRAIDLACGNVKAAAGGPFAAVIVKDGIVVAEAANSVTTTNDPTAHGEINAIRKACAVLGTFSLEGCEIYSSCEPCPSQQFTGRGSTELFLEVIAKPPHARVSMIPFCIRK